MVLANRIAGEGCTPKPDWRPGWMQMPPARLVEAQPVRLLMPGSVSPGCSRRMPSRNPAPSHRLTKLPLPEFFVSSQVQGSRPVHVAGRFLCPGEIQIV